MNRSFLTYALGATALALGVAACSGSTTSPGLTVSNTEMTQTVTSDAGDAIANSVDFMVADEAASGASASLVTGAPGVSANLGAAVQASTASANCSGPDSNGWYTCQDTTFRGLAITRMLRFWEGTNYGLWWSASTDSINHIATVAGSYTQGWFPFRTVWVNRADTATMIVDRSTSPVQHSWNRLGYRQDSTQVVKANVTKSWHYTAYDTASAVAFDMPRSQYPWPQSGTIVHNMTVVVDAHSATQSFTKTVQRRAMVTFNGTQDVTLQVGGVSCTLDLLTHQVSNCTGS